MLRNLSLLALVLATTTTSVEARRKKDVPKISLVEVLDAFDMLPKPETFARLRDGPTP
jgi:hypothetical protein